MTPFCERWEGYVSLPGCGRYGFMDRSIEAMRIHHEQVRLGIATANAAIAWRSRELRFPGINDPSFPAFSKAESGFRKVVMSSLHEDYEFAAARFFRTIPQSRLSSYAELSSAQ